jgi:cell division protein FtsB
MTRAKERLKQLEARNKALEGEVVNLRQHIAILDHIVATKKEDAALPSQD